MHKNRHFHYLSLMRIYIPFCGIGLGHAFRSMEIGKELEKRGHTVLYSTYEPTYSKLKSRGFKIRKTGIEAIQCQSGGSMDLFGTMAKTSLSLTKTPFLIKEHVEIIKKFKPGLIIADTFFAALTAGKLSGKPVLFITNQTDVGSFFPGRKYFAIRALIDASYNGFASIADRFLIPDIPLPDAICRYNMKFFGHREKFIFAGPVVQKNPNHVKAKKFSKLTILVTLGGSGLKADISKHMKSSPKTDFIVVNSPFERREGNVIYKKFVPDYFAYLKGCDALLTHGGHTSIMEAVVFGKPVLGISLKGYAERENNLKGITRNGNGCVVKDMKGALANLAKYKKNAKRLQKIALKNRGAENIVKIAEEFE